VNKVNRRHILLVASLSVIPAEALAGDLLCGRKLRNRCGLPSHDYSRERFSPPISGSSLRAIRSTSLQVRSGDTAASAGARETAAVLRAIELDELPPGELKVFQIEPATLRIDHCAVSQVVVTIAESGEWMLSLQAQQDPRLESAQLRTQFENFRRNEFRLEVRPILVLTARQNADVAVLGKPELDAIDAQEFWLDKHEVRRITLKNSSQDLRRYFAQIEQVDVHFSYR
jgi:hypothetical protein